MVARYVPGVRFAGAPVEAVRRAPSANTCFAAQFALAASHTLPENCVHSAEFVKSSAPSITAPAAEARITIGFPVSPDVGIVTCSR